MAQVNFQPLIDKVLQDEEFGSKLVNFAKAHGVDLLSEELSDHELQDVSGGTSLSTDTTLTYSLEYDVELLSDDELDTLVKKMPGRLKWG
jgi:hypothetical protein